MIMWRSVFGLQFVLQRVFPTIVKGKTCDSQEANKSPNAASLNNFQGHRGFKAFTKWKLWSSQIDEPNLLDFFEAKRLKLSQRQFTYMLDFIVFRRRENIGSFFFHKLYKIEYVQIHKLRTINMMFTIWLWILPGVPIFSDFSRFFNRVLDGIKLSKRSVILALR